MRHARTTAVPACLLLGAALALTCGGCDDDPVAPCPYDVPAGRIEGRVRTGGLPMASVIAATQIVDGAATPFLFETELDGEGRYAIDLPAGYYVITLRVGSYRTTYDYAASGLSYGHLPPDTLLVDEAHSPTGIDFDLGGLTLELDLSEHLEGEQGEVILHRRDAVETGQWRTFVDRGGAEIADGHLGIQIPGILPGEYRIEIVLGRRAYACECPYDGEHFWMPATRDSADSPWYEIVADSVRSLGSAIAADPARIEGRIVGAWLDMGLDAPELSIVNPDSVTIMGRRRVESDGSFAVNVHIPGPVKLLATQDGIEQWFGGPSFEDASVYVLELGQAVSGLELVQSGVRLRVDAPGSFEGQTTFRLYDPTDLTLLATGDIEDYNDRHVALSNLWPGHYLLFVSPIWWQIGYTSWRPQWFDRATGPEQARVVSITSAGEVTVLDLFLELGGVIRGRVETADGVPRFFHILVTPADERVTRSHHYAFEWSPDYEVKGLPDGAFKVGAYPVDLGWTWPDPPPDGTVWYPGTTDWESAGIVDIRDAAVVTDVDIEMR